jgi:hypothetical protein
MFLLIKHFKMIPGSSPPSFSYPPAYPPPAHTHASFSGLHSHFSPPLPFRLPQPRLLPLPLPPPGSRWGDGVSSSTTSSGSGAASGAASMPSADSMPTTCKHIANHGGWILRRVLGFNLVACATPASLPMVLGCKHRPRTCADECPECAHINARTSAHSSAHISAQMGARNVPRLVSRMCLGEVAVLCPDNDTAK